MEANGNNGTAGENCPGCNDLKIPQNRNGRRQVEVPSDFGLAAGETVRSQIAEGISAINLGADGRSFTHTGNAGSTPSRQVDHTLNGYLRTSAHKSPKLKVSLWSQITQPTAHIRNFTLAETNASSVLALNQSSGNSAPTREKPSLPAEPATGDDCDEWAQDYLEWLKDNGELVNQDPIVIKCGNKTYVFRRTPDGDEWDWMLEVRDVGRDLEDAITDQLGTPAPSNYWDAPDKEEDYDDYVSDPEETVERDADGKEVKRVLSTPGNCAEMRVRVLDRREWLLRRSFEFEKEYIVQDSEGAADADEIEKLREAQNSLFLRQLVQVAGNLEAEPAWPTQTELVSSISRLAMLIIGKRYFDCESPCKMDVKLVGLRNLVFSSAPEKPMGDGRDTQRISGRTQALPPTREGGYWKVKIRSVGTVVIQVAGDIEVDVFCKN